MFGEMDSEDLGSSWSPRSRSPWDLFLPSSSDGDTSSASGSYLNSGKHLTGEIPKLVPEVEEGNVEYKLKLTSITAARFARLVTQLKWRLLEGQGQAYYELGVADSGALIGLTRRDMEESLETLEFMAGEIGASVIVVKEIEVPAEVSRRADVGGLVQGDGWAGKMRKRGVPASDDDDLTSTTETELSTADGTDAEDSPWSTSKPSTPIDAPFASARTAAAIYSVFSVSHPARPAAQSSPAILPVAGLDDDLALFSMEPEPEFDISADIEDSRSDAIVNMDLNAADGPLQIDLEISSVYKPRPVRTRAQPQIGAGGWLPVFTGLSKGKLRKLKGREKKGQTWTKPLAPALPLSAAAAVESAETKAAKRRAARDKRREEKRRAFLAGCETGGGHAAQSIEVAVPVVGATLPAATAAIFRGDLGLEENSTGDLVASLQTLHITPAPGTSPVGDVVSAKNIVADAEVDGTFEVLEEVASLASQPRLEPRLIVEALVVRKSSIEEALLDFGGFSLVQ